MEGQNLEIKKTLYQYSALLEQQRALFLHKRRLWLDPGQRPALFPDHTAQYWEALVAKVGSEEAARAGRRLLLLSMDQSWAHHLAALSDLREGIHMARLGGQDPLVVFHKEAIALFDNLETQWKTRALEAFVRLTAADGKIEWEDCGLTAPSSTWTYLVNDNPFEHSLAANLAGRLPLAIAAGVWWPVLMIMSLMKKFGKTKRE